MSPLSLLLATIPLAVLDTVQLNDGKVIEGRVVLERADDVVVRADHKDQHIARKDIAQIHSLERSLAPIVDRDWSAADAATLQAIATECEKAGLAAEAKNVWLRVLIADPTNDAALKGAGAKRTGKDVKLSLGKGQRNLGELTKPQSSWKQAYELATTHFVVRSDMELPLVLDLALALERFHKRFYETLAAPLELYVFEDAPEVCVYARKSDFPNPPVEGDTVWFAPGTQRVHVLASMNPSVATIVTELSQMMLLGALRRGAGSNAQVPLWTAEGIAQMFASAAPRERVGTWAEISAPDRAVFSAAKSAELPLERVFNATADDFKAVSGDDNDARAAKSNRRSMQASAYALVHYLVFGEHETLRQPFGKLVRDGSKSKLSLNAFGQALGKSVKDIESGWRAHVDAQTR